MSASPTDGRIKERELYAAGNEGGGGDWDEVDGRGGKKRKRGWLHSPLTRVLIAQPENGGPNRSHKKKRIKEKEKKRFKMEVRSCSVEAYGVKSGGRLAAVLAIETGRKSP